MPSKQSFRKLKEDFSTVTPFPSASSTPLSLAVGILLGTHQVTCGALPAAALFLWLCPIVAPAPSNLAAIGPAAQRHFLAASRVQSRQRSPWPGSAISHSSQLRQRYILHFDQSLDIYHKETYKSALQPLVKVVSKITCIRHRTQNIKIMFMKQCLYVFEVFLVHFQLLKKALEPSIPACPAIQSKATAEIECRWVVRVT